MTKQELFENCTFWVACDTENAVRLFLNHEDMIRGFEHYSYIAAFDWSGVKVAEAKVIFDEGNGRNVHDLIFDY